MARLLRLSEALINLTFKGDISCYRCYRCISCYSCYRCYRLPLSKYLPNSKAIYNTQNIDISSLGGKSITQSITQPERGKNKIKSNFSQKSITTITSITPLPKRG